MNAFFEIKTKTFCEVFHNDKVDKQKNRNVHASKLHFYWMRKQLNYQFEFNYLLQQTKSSCKVHFVKQKA